MHSIQVADGHILQQVLDGVAQGWQGQLPAVAREDGVVNLLEQDCGGRAGGECFGGVVDGECQGDGQLEDLMDKDGGGGEEAVVANGRHRARVVHDLERARSWRRAAAGQIWVSISNPGRSGGTRGKRLLVHTRIRAEFWKVS